MSQTKAEFQASAGPAAQRYEDARYSPHIETASGDVSELRNLIQVASSGVSILARDPGVEAAQPLRQVADRMRSGLDRAGLLVRETIALSTKVPHGPDLVVVGDCLAEVGALFAPTFASGIRIAFDIAPELPPAVCDRQGLRDVVISLVFNARDAMPDGGLITITAAASRENGSEVIDLSVTDSGIGMSEQTMIRAFEPFFTTKGHGLGGIGLPTVMRFAEDAGGRVEVRSKLGSGTTVTIRLPAAG